MGYVRITDRPEELFHYTRRDNLASILRDGRIKRMGDAECWFCSTLDDTLELMRATVMVEGKPYVKLGGSIGRYHRTFLCPVPYVHKVGIKGKNQKFPRLRN